MFKIKIIIALFFSILILDSCKKEQKNDYEIPTTYNFANVNYEGQTERLQMLSQLSTYAKTANAVSGPLLDAALMKDMYNNSNSPFSPASSSLNSSSRKLKDKTVSTEQDLFELVLDSLAAASAHTGATAANGVPGIVQNNAGTRAYLLNSKGVELVQILEKGLMGACFYYQATAVYLGSGKMDVDNETVTPGQGTAMEHHWDEAFGYFGVSIDFPSNTDALFWGRYCNNYESLLGLNATIMNAFLAGRAAISNKDLEKRNVQITLVRRNWELVSAAAALHYINEALDKFNTDAGVKFHALSEAYAFVYSLKWGGDATISSADVNALLNGLGGSTNPLEINFYNTTSASLQNVKDALVNAFGKLASVKDAI